MHLRHRCLHRLEDLDVGAAGVFGMDAPLHAHFRAAPRPGFPGAPLDLVVGQIVGAPAQVFRQLALGKGAELALEIADIGVVDVAVDDKTDGVAVDGRAQRIGGPGDGAEVLAPRLEQAHHVVLGEVFALSGRIENGFKVR